MAAIQQGKIAKAPLVGARHASKMLPIMFLPIVWRWLGWRKGLIFNAIFAVVCLVLFVPILVMLPNMLDSLDLYFRNSSSTPAFITSFGVGFSKIGWDIGAYSGPALAGLTVLGVLIIAWRTKRLSKVELSPKVQNFRKFKHLTCYLPFSISHSQPPYSHGTVVFLWHFPSLRTGVLW
ncbi:MAG: hypothetical protein IPH31_05605 [Lewinellaceae bacterium]|nr:hypothetical protein [Lewinellaceae bacterium]